MAEIDHPRRWFLPNRMDPNLVTHGSLATIHHPEVLDWQKLLEICSHCSEGNPLSRASWKDNHKTVSVQRHPTTKPHERGSREGWQPLGAAVLPALWEPGAGEAVPCKDSLMKEHTEPGKKLLLLPVSLLSLLAHLYILEAI